MPNASMEWADMLTILTAYSYLLYYTSIFSCDARYNFFLAKAEAGTGGL